jgi:hypothetical protein
MRVGLHTNQCPQALALQAGFEALGWRVSWRDGEHYRQGQLENFDAVAVAGCRGNNRDVLRDYTAAGIPALVIEWGYLKRAGLNRDGYWQLGLGDLGWLPPMACKPDRWRALGLKLGKPHDGVIIIAGQMVGDAAHPFADAASMEAWALQMASGCRTAHLFRPHPRSPDVAPKGLEIDRLPLRESLARAHLVVAYSSNIGNDALMAGCQVFASGPAIWAGVTPETRRNYFHRLAYAQWTLAEIATGEPIDFVLRAYGDHANR